jgi:hypothetical protein
MVAFFTMSFHNPNNNISRGKLASSSNKWRNEERHYCSACNVWMGSDRQSIRLHENGKKHKENVEFQLSQRRQTVLREEKEVKKVQGALQQMEQAAAAKMGIPYSISVHRPSSSTSTTSTTTNVSYVVGPTTVSTSNPKYPPAVDRSNLIPLKNPLAENSTHKAVKMGISANVELNAWHERKMKREKDRTAKQLEEEEEEGTLNGTAQTNSCRTALSSTITQGHLSEGEGHYTVGTRTYLEGRYYASLFQPDMPIQIWTGGHSLHNPMVQHEMRQECNNTFWKCGLIVKVTQTGNRAIKQHGMAEVEQPSMSLAFDVAYLLHPDDEDETLEQKVDPTRLRLELSKANNTHPRIPQSVEEARLMLVGGEEEEVVFASPLQTADEKEVEIDENTGFTKFRTISIKRRTVAKEEETRQQNMLVDEQGYITRQQQEEATKRERMEQTKMEEAKYLGAEDSALGAYDVWGQGGYKGVRITDDLATTAVGNKRSAAALIISANNSTVTQSMVGFKKRNIQKRNVRVTSGED